VTIKTDGFHFLLCSCDEAVDLVRQSTFHMDDDGDLQEQILHLEAQIEELADVIERCRKIILISKAAIAAGGTLILAIIIGAVGFDPTIMIGAIAAVIGGIVVFGSNTSIAPTRMGSSRYIKVSMRLHVLPDPQACVGFPSIGEWNDDDFDVLADGVVVGRIFKAHRTGRATGMFGHHEDRTPTHGYAATREEAMKVFAKSWRRE
jgi:hypothetical protein